MGTDIHAVFQARENGAWHDIHSDWPQNRHYFLFAWLANVRNGYGFAGVRTHTPVVPIAKPRGLPDDFAVDDASEHITTSDTLNAWRRAVHEKYPDEYGLPDGGYRMWMGDHSHSWLTAGEILNAQRPGATMCGVVDRKVYAVWDGHSQPPMWDGDVAGRDVHIVDDLDFVGDWPPKEATHVRIRWQTPDNALDYFVDEVRRLVEQHGTDVRLVFGFDS
jgi:hypothetical protein